jgi:hypothetical protein
VPASREIVPEGAPREILEHFRNHPGDTIRSVIEALKLDLSTAYYGLTRLHDLGLVRRIGAKRPARWEVVAEAADDQGPVPLIPGAAEGPIKLFSNQPVYRPTGALVTPGMHMLCFRISSGRAPEREYCREGRRPGPSAEHPWSYSNRNKKAA